MADDKVVRVIVGGAAGRMGRKLIAMVQLTPGIILTGAYEHPDHPDIGKDAGALAGVDELEVTISNIVGAIQGHMGAYPGDVIIDFTSPEAVPENIKIITECERSFPMVIGTTGIAGEALGEVTKLAQKVPVVMAPNMSVGVNVMFKIVGEMARILGNDYDMELLEVHHRFKKDAPSGTAMKLAQILAEAVGRNLDDVAVYKRKGLIGERTDEEIGIQTWRAGDIPGEHTVMFGGIGERLEIIHRAHSRDNFARGALRAAKWVVERPFGLFDMQSVLGI
ncbi:MAG: 4-hydroxy-tetrahydrodipicolinate reductase [Patescibacteria group bacterium]